MKKNQPPKKPKNILNKRTDLRFVKSALIMRLGHQQIEMIKTQPFKYTDLKAVEVANQILNMSEAIKNLFNPKAKYLERINKK